MATAMEPAPTITVYSPPARHRYQDNTAVLGGAAESSDPTHDNDDDDGILLELNEDSDVSSPTVTPESHALAVKQLWAAEGIEIVAPSVAEMALAASTLAEKELQAAGASAGAGDDEKVAFEGFLRKRYSSSLYMGSWRFCVVHGNRMRWYMTEELARKDQQMRGEVFIKSVEPWNGHGSVNVYPHAFSVRTTSNRVLLCSAKSNSEKERWVQHLARSVVSERQRRLSRRLVRNHHDGLSLGHAHGPESAERRRIVPEDAVRAMAVSDVTSAYGNSINESINGSMGGASDVKTASPRQQASTSVVSRSSEVSESAINGHSTQECSRCAIRFGTFVARRVVCSSCHYAFCSRHCNKYVRLHHTASQAARRCCMRCARRQEFIVYLNGVLAFTTSLARTLGDGDKCIMSLIQRPAPSDPSQLAQEDFVYERTVAKLRTAPMSLIKTIKILYQTRQKPHLFCVACERLPFYVENCIDRVESLWYQILHLFQCCDSEFSTFSMQLFCLKRYIAAICRRSPRIALQTIWHVQASVEDSSRHNPNSLLLLLGVLYPPTIASKVWSELLLADTPEHQRTAILEKLVAVHEAGLSIRTNEPNSLIERWLSATKVEEFQLCATELDRSGIQIIDFQTNIQYESLKIADTDEERSHLEEVVADQVRFVQLLAAISERLRHVQPIEDRSKHLGTELTQLNDNLIASALYPLCVASDELYKVVRVPPNEGKVFSTKMRAPTLIFIEAVPVDAANLIGAERLLPFTSRRRGSLTFIESISELVDETTKPRDSLSSSAESDVTAHETTPHHRRHGSQLSLPDSIDTMSNATEEDVMTPTNASCNRPQQARSLGGMLNQHMTFPRDNNRSASTHSMPNGGFSLGALGAPTTPRITHARMDNIVYDSKVYGESWEERRDRIRRESPHGDLPGWQLFSIIVKTNDDLRQEMFTMQMMTKLKSIFEFEQLGLWLRTYRIVATGANIGIMETINEACSLDHLKKTFNGGHMYAYFRATYGDPGTPSFEIAKRNFIQSMAAYSIVSYVLLVKDRHNGNILLSAEGHIIHIDFGFILGIAPGGMFSIEDAPFKLTEEMIMIMGGLSSTGFAMYRQLMCDGFLVLQKYQSEIAALLQTTGQHSPFPCFEGAKLARVVSDLRGRLCVGLTKRQVEKRVDHLIKQCYNAWGTRKYDSFQLRSNNIHP